MFKKILLRIIKIMGIFMLLLFVFCLEDPIAPPGEADDASASAVKAVKKSLTGLKYYEQSFRFKNPFFYDIAETLSLNLVKMPLEISREFLNDPFPVKSRNLYAKRLFTEQKQSALFAYSLPFSAYWSYGDSIYTDSIDNFKVIITKLPSNRTIAPVDSGYDSLFYINSKLHHVNSKLYIYGGILISEKEFDADGDEFISTPTTNRLTYIQRKLISGDTTYLSIMDVKYADNSNNPECLKYREYIIKDGDTISARVVTRTDNAPITLAKNERLKDSIYYFKGDKKEEYTITRLLANSDKINAFSDDKYTSFEKTVKTANDTIKTIWTDSDNDGILWNPLSDDTSRVTISRVGWHNTGNVSVRVESISVCLLENKTAPSQRIKGYTMTDSLRDKSGVVIRKLLASPSGRTMWEGDTIYVQETSIYNNNSMAECKYGKIIKTSREYRLITSEYGKAQYTDYMKTLHTLELSNEIQYYGEELVPDGVLNLDSTHCTKGNYYTTTVYRRGGNSIFHSATDDYEFDFGSSKSCTWVRTLISQKNDSIVQTVSVNNSNIGKYSVSRFDSLYESMSFNISTGEFKDTLWEKIPKQDNSIIKQFWGTFNKTQSTISWHEQTDNKIIDLKKDNNGLTILGADTSVGDSIFIPIKNDTLVWDVPADNYNCKITYSKINDGRIHMELQGWTKVDSLLHLTSRDIYVHENGTGSGFIVEKNSGSDINYSLIINLLKESSFSGDDDF